MDSASTRHWSRPLLTTLNNTTALAAVGIATVVDLRHRRIPCLEGVQFHPESILTEHGKDLLRNFIRMRVA